MSEKTIEERRLELLVEENSRAPEDTPTPNWTTEEMRKEFEVIGFGAPVVAVKRRSDGVVGSLMFRHEPRIYYNFQPHE